MAFIQIIEQTTTKIDEIQALVEKQRANSGAAPNVRRSTVTKDRDRENVYLVIVEFDSYESAMENSNAAETQAMVAEMAELLDAPPKFYNLDVVMVMDE
jgi:quinol monooxygenase YgiN